MSIFQNQDFLNILSSARKDPSAGYPLSDMLEESGESDLAEMARKGHFAFLGQVLGFLAYEHFDPYTMRIVVQKPKFSIDPRWLVWRTIEVKPGIYRRLALMVKHSF